VIEYASVPALLALAFKLILIAYSARSPIKSVTTWLFLALLIVFTLLNVDEFIFLNGVAKYGLTPSVNAGGFVYVALWVVAIPLLLHLSLVLSFEEHTLADKGSWIVALYIPILPIEFLLFFTDVLVIGFKPFLYSILRIPGPLYWIGESWAIAYLSLSLAVLAYGARSSRPALARIRARLWLLALSPMLLLVIYMILAHHMNWPRLTFPVHIPIVMTFFLLMTTYATHERPRPGGFYRFLYRLFDLESYLPWSSARRRKAALHSEIRDIAANLEDVGSTRDIVERLSELFQCPAALMNCEQLAIETGSSQDIAEFPRAVLPSIHRIVFAHEEVRRTPELQTLMTRHKVAAIVPFHPHSRAASWMLFGEGFSDRVYTPVDFDEVKVLFDRLSGYLLDEQIHMREQLSQTQQESLELRLQIETANQHLNLVNQQLVSSNGWRTQELESITPDAQLEADAREVAARRKTLTDCVADLERRLIVNALERCGGNQSKAAEFLGLRPNTLHYKIQRYRLSIRDLNP